MYCPHCGKENTLNARFCIYCGKEISTNTDTQNQPQPNSNAKPKRKPWIGIIIGIGAFLLSTAVIAPIVANSFDNNNPSVNNGFSEKENNSFVSGESVITKEYFSEVEDTISSTIMLIARGNEVMTISGNFFLSDLSVSEFDDVKYNFSTMQEIVKNNNVENILIDINETAYSYSITFSFTNLNYESGELAAKSAADLLGFKSDSDKIKLSEAESTLLANGYILKAEY